MHTIHKFPLTKFNEVSTITAPVGMKVVRAAVQQAPIGGEGELNQVQLWAEVRTAAPEKEYRYKLVGTGRALPQGLVHIESFKDSNFIWHLYMEPEVKL